MWPAGGWGPGRQAGGRLRKSEHTAEVSAKSSESRSGVTAEAPLAWVQRPLGDIPGPSQ